MDSKEKNVTNNKISTNSSEQTFIKLSTRKKTLKKRMHNIDIIIFVFPLKKSYSD